MLRVAILAGLALGTLAVTPSISDSKYQAKVMGNVDLRAGPSWRSAVIGGVRNGATFAPRTCTHEHGWCLIVNKRGQAIGWVEADRLSGVSAKAQVTPWRPLFDPFRDGWPRKPVGKPTP
jgi:uncharacterized protein YraI